MKLYLTDSIEKATLYRHLLRIKGECERLKWLKGISKLPTKVSKSSDTVQEYCEEQILLIIKSSTLFCELSEEDENLLFELYTKSDILKKYLGSCCVLTTKESSLVIKEFEKLSVNSSVRDAMKTGKNVLMY